VQDFTFNSWQELSDPVFAETTPTPKTYTPNTDFAAFEYSGSGDVTAEAKAVDPGATGLGSGCEADDFAGFPRGDIALVQRGGCTFAIKAENAIAAVAAAVVIYQQPGVGDKIALMLDFDMLASPNYVRFVYDGDNSTGQNNVPGPAGSGAIEKTFNDYFAGRGLATDPTAFDGRSDYNAFISVGIPAGGIFTGAEGIKTPEQAATYGGTAGQPYDPCYHQACDRYDNVNLTGFDQMIDATAYATEVFANSTLTVNGVDRAEAKRAAATQRPDRVGHYWIR
jgi:hypothetical protein